MKTTLAILIAGLILLATPMLAAAHGDGHNDRGPKYFKSWDKGQHDQHHYRSDYRPHKAKKHLKKQVRKQRRQIKKLQHRIDHQQHRIKHQQRRHQRHHYARYDAYWFSAPRVVFHFGW